MSIRWIMTWYTLFWQVHKFANTETACSLPTFVSFSEEGHKRHDTLLYSNRLVTNWKVTFRDMKVLMGTLITNARAEHVYRKPLCGWSRSTVQKWQLWPLRYQSSTWYQSSTCISWFKFIKAFTVDQEPYLHVRQKCTLNNFELK